MRSVYASVIDKIETPDKYTVKFTLSKTDPAFLAKLAPWRAGPIAKATGHPLNTIKYYHESG